MTTAERVELAKKMTRYEVAKIIRIGAVVDVADVGLCRVSGFDLTKSVQTMPVSVETFADKEIHDITLPDILAVMVPIGRLAAQGVRPTT